MGPFWRIVGSFCALICPLVVACHLRAQPVVRVGPGGDTGFEAASGESIQRAVERLATSGGTILLAPGDYLVRQTIRIRGAKGLKVEGGPGVQLVLEAAPASSLAAPAAAGDLKIRLSGAAGFSPGHEIELLRTSPKVPLTGRVTRVEADGSLALAKALAEPAPAGTPVMVTENVITILDSAENVTLASLDIDLQSGRQPFPPINHTRQCGILVAGLYDYAKGVRSFCRGIRILDCTIRNAHHRGIALYAVTDAEVSGCRIENTGAEAIDIDHYCRNIRVTDNRLKKGQMAGIEINDGADNLIARNLIENYPIGILCWRYPPCLMPDANQRNVVTGNVIRDSIEHAISFRANTEFNSITRNVIDGVQGSHGILMMGDRSRIEENRIANTPKGDIRDGGKANTVRRLDGQSTRIQPQDSGRRPPHAPKER